MNRGACLPATPLWGFELLLADTKRCSGRPKASFATRQAGLGAEMPCYRVRRPVKNGVFASTGKAVPHRHWPTNFQRASWASSAVHEAPGSNGGARISAPRPKVSMMTMATPQSGQTKVG